MIPLLNVGSGSLVEVLWFLVFRYEFWLMVRGKKLSNHVRKREAGSLARGSGFTGGKINDNMPKTY